VLSVKLKSAHDGHKPPFNADPDAFEQSTRGISEYRSGPVWSDERFDHFIRRADELKEKLQYVRRNRLDGVLWII
jgi:hypothetical protein